MIRTFKTAANFDGPRVIQGLLTNPIQETSTRKRGRGHVFETTVTFKPRTLLHAKCDWCGHEEIVDCPVDQEDLNAEGVNAIRDFLHTNLGWVFRFEPPLHFCSRRCGDGRNDRRTEISNRGTEHVDTTTAVIEHLRQTLVTSPEAQSIRGLRGVVRWALDKLTESQK